MREQLVPHSAMVSSLPLQAPSPRRPQWLTLCMPLAGVCLSLECCWHRPPLACQCSESPHVHHCLCAVGFLVLTSAPHLTRCPPLLQAPKKRVAAVPAGVKKVCSERHLLRPLPAPLSWPPNHCLPSAFGCCLPACVGASAHVETHAYIASPGLCAGSGCDEGGQPAVREAAEDLWCAPYYAKERQPRDGVSAVVWRLCMHEPLLSKDPLCPLRS